MVLVWTVTEVMFLLFFFSLPPTDEFSSVVSRPKGPINQSADTYSASNQEQSSETAPLIMQQKMTLLHRIWEMIREETIVLLVILFMTMFNQTSIEVSRYDSVCRMY